jgi:hypothetical protein
MNNTTIYALKFREKGKKLYRSVLIQAKDNQELTKKFNEFLDNDIYDVDKRTVSWAGGNNSIYDK